MYISRSLAGSIYKGVPMPVEIITGNGPVILALPYTGTNIPRTTAMRLLTEDSLVTAPDRCLDRLLSGVHPDLTVVRARFHRFLSDVEQPPPQYNRAPVPGMMGVVPLRDPKGKSIWYEPPGAKEASRWHSTFFVPYHAALRGQIARVRSQFGHAVLVTCRAMPGNEAQEEHTRPVALRMSNNLGTSCAIDLSSRLMALFLHNAEFTTLFSRRVETGWATRSYARPTAGIHAVVLEVSETAYLGQNEMAGVYDEQKSEPLRALLAEAFDILDRWRPA